MIREKRSEKQKKRRSSPPSAGVKLWWWLISPRGASRFKRSTAVLNPLLSLLAELATVETPLCGSFASPSLLHPLLPHPTSSCLAPAPPKGRSLIADHSLSLSAIQTPLRPEPATEHAPPLRHIRRGSPSSLPTSPPSSGWASETSKRTLSGSRLAPLRYPFPRTGGRPWSVQPHACPAHTRCLPDV